MFEEDGADQGTSFTDSSSGAKTVANTEAYDSYTKLMLHMEDSGNSFTDSVASKAVTATGDVTQTTAQSKLGSRSAVFDGNGDYLSLADSDDWTFGSGDFTIDTWVRFNVFPSSGSLFTLVEQMTDGNNFFAYEFYESGGSYYLRFREQVASSNHIIFSSAALSVSTGTWYHLTIVRNGNSWYHFIDGVQTGSTYTNSDSMNNWAGALWIGASNIDVRYFNGTLDELRISKGIARWTSNFTPPSSSYGKVSTVTGTKKFGTASGEFKGSGDYLSLADSDDWNFGTGDFTIDFWVRFNDVSVEQHFIAQYQDVDNLAIELYKSTLGSGNRLSFAWKYNGTYLVNATSAALTWSTGVWYHLAIVRHNGSVNLYRDGITVLSAVLSGMGNISGDLEIGRRWDGYYVNGYLDELRISKGIARWTSNFTPPSAPYDVDTTTPTVSSTSPASSATGVGVSSAISATFSEDMDSSTITTSTFTLSSSSGSSVSGTVSYSNKVATFTPSSNLSYSTTYTAQ